MSVMCGLICVFVSGCASEGYQNNSSAITQGAIGAGIGAVAGGVIGNNSHGAFGNREGMVAGAAIGGLLGGTMGHNADTNRKQNTQMQNQINSVNESANTTIVNVKNSNGSMTPVTIKRIGNQYVGPRGEYYSYLPGENDLKMAYGF